jgi:hypothetical protein
MSELLFVSFFAAVNRTKHIPKKKKKKNRRTMKTGQHLIKRPPRTRTTYSRIIIRRISSPSATLVEKDAKKSITIFGK